MKEIEKYQGFRYELAIAETFEEIKFIENKAAAVAEFVRKNKIGKNEQDQWGIFRVEIDVKKGAWLDKKFPYGGDRKSSLSDSNLKKEGITPEESTQARNILHNPIEVQEIIEEIKQSKETVTPSLVNTKLKKLQKKIEVSQREAAYKKEIKLVNAFDIDIFNTDKKFNIIYADPPWYYWEGGEKNQSLHYKTMTIDEICSLPVKNISDDNCILFLWVTYPILFNAIKVIESWGFNYSTCGFVWVKRNKNTDSWFFGNGAWTRANSEVCLIATKGSIVRMNASISQVLDDRIMEHSQKPIRVRKLITELVGGLPRIELFSRCAEHDGWFNWGNKI